MKKHFTLALTCIFMLAGTTTAFAGEWKEDEKGWRYQEDDGSYVANTWQTIDGKDYYFFSDGYLYTNYITSDGYLVGSDGAKSEQYGIPLDKSITASTGSYSINPLIFQEFNSTAGELKERYGLESKDEAVGLPALSMPIAKSTEDVTFSDSSLFQSYEIYTHVVPPDMNIEKYDLNGDGVIDYNDVNIAYSRYYESRSSESQAFYVEIQNAIAYRSYYDWEFPPCRLRTKEGFYVFQGLGDSCSVERLGEIVRQMGATDIDVLNKTENKEIVLMGPGTGGLLFTPIYTGQYEDVNATKISFVIHGLKFWTSGEWGNVDMAGGNWVIERVFE